MKAVYMTHKKIWTTQKFQVSSLLIHEVLRPQLFYTLVGKGTHKVLFRSTIP